MKSWSDCDRLQQKAVPHLVTLFMAVFDGAEPAVKVNMLETTLAVC